MVKTVEELQYVFQCIFVLALIFIIHQHQAKQIAHDKRTPYNPTRDTFIRMVKGAPIKCLVAFTLLSHFLAFNIPCRAHQFKNVLFIPLIFNKLLTYMYYIRKLLTKIAKTLITGVPVLHVTMVQSPASHLPHLY